MPIGGVHQDNWKCPYGRTGEDRFAKEAFEVARETCLYEYEEYDIFPWESDMYGDAQSHFKPKCPRGGYRSVVCYKADGEDVVGRWGSPVHMPRWASRFTVTLDVGLKRIQEVTEEEAKMSGVDRLLPIDVSRMPYPTSEIQGQLAASIEGQARGSWNRNDYFWKITCTLKK